MVVDNRLKLAAPLKQSVAAQAGLELFGIVATDFGGRVPPSYRAANSATRDSMIFATKPVLYFPRTKSGSRMIAS